MTSETAHILITEQITVFGILALGILGSLITVIVGLLVARWAFRTVFNYPGGYGYNPRQGSGMSRFQTGRRNASGGANLLG